MFSSRRLNTVRLALQPASRAMATAPQETQDGPASSEPVVPDSHNPGIPNTIKGHKVSSEMWHAVNELSTGDQNFLTKEVEPSWSAPHDYDVHAVLRERLQLLHELAQRQRQRDLQSEQ